MRENGRAIYSVTHPIHRLSLVIPVLLSLPVLSHVSELRILNKVSKCYWRDMERKAMFASGTQAEMPCWSQGSTRTWSDDPHSVPLRQRELKWQEPKRVKIIMFFFVPPWRCEVRRCSLSSSWDLAGLFTMATTTRDWVLHHRWETWFPLRLSVASKGQHRDPANQ